MDEVNPEFQRTDVTLVIGANDVTNPAAKNEPGSPIYGMPILEVDKSQSVIVLKRSMASGFAGIDNPLFYEPQDQHAVRRREVERERDHRSESQALVVRIPRWSAPWIQSRLKAIPIFSRPVRRGGAPAGRVRHRDEHRRGPDPDEAGRLLGRADRDRGGKRRRDQGRHEDRLARQGRPDRRDGPVRPPSRATPT